MTELFEKYYQNKLSSSERLDFDQKLKSDDEFAQDYNAYVMMMDFMDSKDDVSNALSNLNDVHEELNQEETPVKKNKTTLLRFLKSPIAAVFVLFMALALFYFYSQLNKNIENPKELFAIYFSPAPVSLSTKGGDIETILIQVNSDYKANKHEDVINALSQVNIDTLDIKNRLYLMLASSYIATGSFSKSREALKPLESSTQFRNEFYWYTGLSYLGEGNVSEARSSFSKIPDDSNYSDRAKSILGKISN